MSSNFHLPFAAYSFDLRSFFHFLYLHLLSSFSFSYDLFLIKNFGSGFSVHGWHMYFERRLVGEARGEYF